jgi:hypothetical protein
MSVLPVHEKLLESIRGTTVSIPDFSEILLKHPRIVNSNRSEVKDGTDKFLEM